MILGQMEYAKDEARKALLKEFRRASKQSNPVPAGEDPFEYFGELTIGKVEWL